MVSGESQRGAIRAWYIGGGVLHNHYQAQTARWIEADVEVFTNPAVRDVTLHWS